MKRLATAILTLLVLFSFVQPAHADVSIRVFYSGADGSVKTALELAKFTLVTNPAQADVFVFNGVIPDDETIRSRLAGGAGLVLILGKDTIEEQVSSLLGMPLALRPREDAVSVTSLDVNDPLLKEIVWNGAPQVRERFDLQTPVSSVQPLVTAYETGEWIVWRAHGNTFVVDAFLDDKSNPQIQEWGYFNYWIYHMTTRAAGREPMSFAAYPASPVPHAAERDILWAVLALMLATTFGAFAYVRRYSQNHPEELDKIVSDRSRFEVREEATEWEEVGFHRPLGGFIVALAIGLVLFIPLIIYQNLILPTFILPSAEALGIWGRVTQFFNLAWYFFDMGTSVAFIKYLSQYRVRDPKRGILFGQFFVWWQALSGAVQVAIVVGFASTLAPKSAYALYAWSVAIHAFIQIPGFYQVFRHAFNGFQRNDYSRLLDLALNVFMPMLLTFTKVG